MGFGRGGLCGGFRGRGRGRRPSGVWKRGRASVGIWGWGCKLV